MDEVSFVNGKTRVYAILGDPIEQVRSPEMVTYELQSRGLNAVLVPIHVASAEFETVLPSLMKIRNLDGLIFTIPFKARALAFADHIGPQAKLIGAFNALARHREGGWVGEIFDGIGCVEGHRRRGISFRDKRVMLMGLGGAGSAIGGAIAAESPKSMRIFDLDRARCERMAVIIRKLSPATEVVIAPPTIEGIDILLNATPVGMLKDARLPLDVKTLPRELIVFDAIVMPETTPLLALAEASGCTVVRGREMMRGQIAKIVDFFIAGEI